MIRIALRGLLLAAGLLCLSACGSGGGGSPLPPPSPVAQIIVATVGPINKIVATRLYDIEIP